MKRKYLLGDGPLSESAGVDLSIYESSKVGQNTFFYLTEEEKFTLESKGITLLSSIND